MIDMIYFVLIVNIDKGITFLSVSFRLVSLVCKLHIPPETCVQLTPDDGFFSLSEIKARF